MTRALLLSMLFAIAAPRAAIADDGPRWLVSLPLMGLERGSLAVQGERYLDRRWAVTAALAGRRVDAGDFDARGVAVGGGGRWFFYPVGRGGGAFVAARLDGTWRWLIAEADGHDLGDTVQLAGTTLVGWRLIAWRHLELTPEVGIAIDREWTGARLAAHTAGAGTIGLTVGYAW